MTITMTRTRDLPCNCEHHTEHDQCDTCHIQLCEQTGSVFACDHGASFKCLDCDNCPDRCSECRQCKCNYRNPDGSCDTCALIARRGY